MKTHLLSILGIIAIVMMFVIAAMISPILFVSMTMILGGIGLAVIFQNRKKELEL